MFFYEYFLIGIGLSMDTLAISIADGVSTKHLRVGNIVVIALFMSFFQAIMPVVGWLIGSGLEEFITSYDHWVAFGLLLLIGSKMTWEGLSKKRELRSKLSLKTLIIQSIATSIDALVIGVSFGLLGGEIITAMFVIGFVTFVFSIVGVYIGKLYSKLSNTKLEAIGGIILIGLGIKILVEHILVN